MTDLAELAAQLSPKARELLARELARIGTPVPSVAPEPIALIGMGCRLPGGIVGPESYWDFLVGGGDGISEVPSDRWDADEFYDPDPAVPGRMTTKWGGFVSDVAGFDAEFFGISPREAQATDPQQRVLLEVAWEALEHAGIPPDSLLGSRTAVMAGLSTWDYMLVSVEHRAEIDAYLSTGIPHSSAVGRIAYQLGLRGPAVAVDTACSSSLVAVHLACQSLRLRESDLALAGGVQLNLSPYIGIALSKYSALSRVGRCKAFDAAADGFVQSEGCGMVVLKRLTDAQRDGDRVLSVLRGSAINQDGRSNGMTAPNAAGAAGGDHRCAEGRELLRADTVNYVEAHGTGTPARRPGRVRGPSRPPTAGVRAYAFLGAVKSNLGHMEAAGGRGSHQGDNGIAARGDSGQPPLQRLEPGHRCIVDPIPRAHRNGAMARGWGSAPRGGLVVRLQRYQCPRGARTGRSERRTAIATPTIRHHPSGPGQDARAVGFHVSDAGRLDGRRRGRRSAG